MIYRKIAVRSADAPKRFYRILLVREDICLRELGCVILTAFKAAYEHAFLFQEGSSVKYVSKTFMDGPAIPELYECMNDYKLWDLDDSFEFLYDTGDNWLFTCRVYKKSTEMPDELPAYIIDGKGQGIWEDNRWSLLEYFEGRVSPEMDHDDEEEGIYMPWNFNNKTFADFDAPLDIEKEQEEFAGKIYADIGAYLDRDDSYTAEYENDEFMDGFFDDDDEDEFMEGFLDDDEDDDEEIRGNEGDALFFFVGMLAGQLMTEHKELADIFSRLEDKYGGEEAMHKMMIALYETMRPVIEEHEAFSYEEYLAEVRRQLDPGMVS